MRELRTGQQLLDRVTEKAKEAVMPVASRVINDLRNRYNLL